MKPLLRFFLSLIIFFVSGVFLGLMVARPESFIFWVLGELFCILAAVVLPKRGD